MPASRILVAGLLLCGLLVAPTHAAEPQEIEFESLTLGFAGAYRVGCWTPVQVTLRGAKLPTTGYVELIVPDGDDVPSRVRSRDIQLVPGQSTTITMYARPGRTGCSATVTLMSDGRTLAKRTWGSAFDFSGQGVPEGLDASEELILQVGPSIGIESIVESVESDPTKLPATTVINIENLAMLPTRWLGYEGVAAVVVSTSQVEKIRGLSAAQLEALDQWVRLGGQLVLCVGAQAPELLVNGGPLVRFLPGNVVDAAQPLSTLTAFEKYCESNTPIAETVEAQEELARRPLALPKLAVERGIIEAAELDVPLVVRAPHGFGQVVFVAADLDRDPFRRWKGLPDLVARLLDRQRPTSATGDDMPQYSSNSNTKEGYHDLEGQLRSSLDQFRGIRLVPFWAVAAMILGYILLIGPGDYFFLKKIVGRMELTWLTFPAIVVVSSLAAYGVGHWLKGDQLRVNQVDLVDFDLASTQVRGTSYLNLFSPRMQTYDLAFRPDAKLEVHSTDKPLVAWLGLAGDGLGGMDTNSASSSLWSKPYDFSAELDRMSEVPVVVMGTKSVTARWQGEVAAPCNAELVDGGAGPVGGWIENRSGEVLADAYLCHGRWAYPLGTLAAGERRDLTEAAEKRRDLRRFISGETTELNDKKQTTYAGREEYDTSSQDTARIVRQMLFFEAAGGQRFAKLLMRYQTFVDASGLLRSGRAVLVARPAASRARWLDGSSDLAGPDDNRLTYYRVVIPVAPNETQP